MSEDPTLTSSPGTSPTAVRAPEEVRVDVLAAKETETSPGPGRSQHPSYAFLVIASLLCLAADLGTKWWAKGRLDFSDGRILGSRRIEVIKGYLGFIFAKNQGGAWGLLQDESEAVRRPFFLVISAVAILFIVTLYRRVTPEQTALKWGLPLVLGGALGNLVDRIRYGYVIDFIDVNLGSLYRWPTFNVADIAIVVGVGLMAIDMFTSRRTPSEPAPHAARPAPREHAEGVGDPTLESASIDPTLESTSVPEREASKPASPAGESTSSTGEAGPNPPERT